VYYGYRITDEGATPQVQVVREYVFGENYYSIKAYDTFEVRIIGYYKVLGITEYIHSFDDFLQTIRPEKFILGGGLQTVKLVDSVKNDDYFFTKMRSIKDNEELTEKNSYLRYICPQLYYDSKYQNRTMAYELLKRLDHYTMACFLYYAIFPNAEHPGHP